MRALFALALALSGCAPLSAAPTPAPSQASRIVSLDYCADQYVLRFVDRDRILALSPQAEAAFSYLRAEAAGIRKVRPNAEDVLALQPDLVVRTYGGGPNAGVFFGRAGVPVLQIEAAQSLSDVARVTEETAAKLGASAEGRAVAAAFEARLARLGDGGAGRRALYLTPGGVTTGPGSLVDELLRAAGFTNFETTPGWRDIPLERLARERPDMVAAAFFDGAYAQPNPWSAMRHPLARSQLEDRPVAHLEGAWTACGGWFVIDAAEAMAHAR